MFLATFVFTALAPALIARAFTSSLVGWFGWIIVGIDGRQTSVNGDQVVSQSFFQIGSFAGVGFRNIVSFADILFEIKQRRSLSLVELDELKITVDDCRGLGKASSKPHRNSEPNRAGKTSWPNVAGLP